MIITDIIINIVKMAHGRAGAGVARFPPRARPFEGPVARAVPPTITPCNRG